MSANFISLKEKYTQILQLNFKKSEMKSGFKEI